MKARRDPVGEVQRALYALGGEATVGDLLAVTALSQARVGRALERLIAGGRAHVRVSASGDIVYHLGRGADAAPVSAVSATGVPFDRKTVQLIRAREGVLSIAELVEHTGLRAAQARREMERLAEAYGGAAQPSLDGHLVWVFEDLMATAHGGFPDREPRPAWVRARPPVLARDWFLRLFGPSRQDTLRRHALGLVVQTALAGKGVVSLQRAIDYLAAREGRRPARRVVEAALRDLAFDFDAPVTTLGGDLFFGFRNLKRQFLASDLVRRRLRLGHTAGGATVFDSADTPERAAARELEAFDRELKKPVTAPG